MCNNTKKKKIGCRIIENVEIAKEVFRMIFDSEEIVSVAKPGQFLNLYCKQDNRILPRPISINKIDKEENTVTIIYGVVGKGTKEFSELKAGEDIDVLGPLGKGFKIDEALAKHIIIGGGIGTPPLLELARNLKGQIEVYLGFKSEAFLVKEFEKLGAKVYISTDDGSLGLKGTVVDLLNKNKASGDMIYACGPKPMLRAVSTWAKDKEIPTQLSLEERMGCGIGACVGCVVKIKDENGWQYKKVCQDGPVFLGQEVVWDD